MENPLYDDLNKLSESIRLGSYPPHLMRSYIRAQFASIEYDCYSYRVILADEIRHNPGVYSIQEQTILRERTSYLENGSVKEKQTRFATTEMILFTLNMVARMAEEKSIDHTSKEWKSFVHALKLRDKLTHPHSLDDVKITKNQFISYLKTMIWYTNTLGFHLKEIVKNARTVED